jgi:non-specific serine/threonine protein kinase/serine/threonine-protein kinase
VSDAPKVDGPLSGTQIGPYRLLELLGEGGMGEVYLARREHEFQQRVAVKMVRQGQSNPEVIRRFLIERQTLASLNHPHIVRLVDGGATSTGTPYLVVDYVEGVPIDAYCAQHQLPIVDRLRLFLAVCDAVAYAHRSLVVHCDLKPANILVTPDGQPKLLDFGIAKLLDPIAAGFTEEAAKTRNRAFTVEFASPEQLRGEPVTTSSDIYALGVILYILLTGRMPYRTTPDSLAAWIRAVCQEDPDPPSVAAEKLARQLRGDLDAIVLKALRKRPQDRYSSVSSLAEDLRRHLDGSPVLALRNTTGYVTRKFVEKHKLGVASGALVLLALIAGLAATLWQARVAARRFDDVRRLAHVFLFDVHDSIQYLPGSTAARSLIAKTGTDYLDRLSRESRGDASLQQEMAQGYLKIGDVEGNPYGANLGDYTTSVATYRKALAIADSLVARDPKSVPARQVAAKSHLDLAFVLPSIGKLPEAFDHANQAQRIYEALLAADPGNPEAKLNLNGAYERQGDLLNGPQEVNLGRAADAVAAYQHALGLIPDLPPSSPLRARALRAKAVLIAKLAMQQDAVGDRAGALPKFQDALRTAEELSDADPTNQHAHELVSAFLNQVAYSQQSLGNFPAAMEAYRKASAIDDEELKADPNNSKARENSIVTEKNLGSLYLYQLKKNDEALPCYRKAADLLEAVSQADPHNLAARRDLSETLTYVATTLLGAGHAAEARVQAARGLAIAKELADMPGATHNLIYNYAWLVLTIDPPDMQNPRDALPYAVKAAQMSPGADEFSILGLAYAGNGDYAHALEAVDKGLKLFPAVEPGKPVAMQQQSLLDDRKQYQTKLEKGGAK